jgi:hypothetical protein
LASAGVHDVDGAVEPPRCPELGAVGRDLYHVLDAIGLAAGLINLVDLVGDREALAFERAVPQPVGEETARGYICRSPRSTPPVPVRSPLSQRRGRGSPARRSRARRSRRGWARVGSARLGCRTRAARRATPHHRGRYPVVAIGSGGEYCRRGSGVACNVFCGY